VTVRDADSVKHPTSRTVGPQLLVPWFDDDREMTVSALDIIGGLDGDVLLPGLGEVDRGPVAKAARWLRNGQGSRNSVVAGSLDTSGC
jgi:hypothetical protein